MKTIVLRIAAVAFAVLPLAASATNFPPKPHQLVTDNAHMLTSADQAKLEQELRTYVGKTSNQVAVLTVPSLEGLTVDDYANQLFHSWGIGQKGEDNGVLLLFAPTERKVRIEVGYGLEGALTDGEAGDIIRNVIHPRYEKGEHSQSVVAGAEAVMHALGDTPYPSRQRGNNDSIPARLLIFLLVAGVLFGGSIAYLIGHRRDDSEEEGAPDSSSRDIPALRHEVVTFPEPVHPHERTYSRASGRRIGSGGSRRIITSRDTRRSDDDDESSLLAAGVAASALGSSDDDSPSPSVGESDSSSGADSGFDFGGGDSGGAGASGDL